MLAVPQKGDYSIALVELQEYLVTISNFSVRVRFYSNSWTLVKKRRKRGGEGKRGSEGSPPCLLCKGLELQERGTVSANAKLMRYLPNHTLSFSISKKNIIHCLISLTSPIKGCFFPLLGQSPCCRTPALISAFNNMCCTSAQKESD